MLKCIEAIVYTWIWKHTYGYVHICTIKQIPLCDAYGIFWYLYSTYDNRNKFNFKVKSSKSFAIVMCDVNVNICCLIFDFGAERKFIEFALCPSVHNL